MKNYDIIKRPILSEKCYEGISSKIYTFEVDKRATKTQIKSAVEQIFNVKVSKVNTSNYDGKPKRQGRSEGYTAAYKKAIVSLTADSKAIEFFESLA